MKRRPVLLSTLVATAVSFPALAFAFGGSGSCPGPMGGGPGAMGPMGAMGPGGDPAVMREAVQATTVDLSRALEAAHAVAPGALSSARLVPFGLSADAAGNNSFAEPALAPTYMVTVMDKGTRTVVSVDGISGKAVVAGTATGVLATPGRPWSAGPDDRKGGRRGGPFGPPTDMSAAKIDALAALAVATKAVKSGKPVMVRGVERDGDKAWLIGIAQAQAPIPAGADKGPGGATVDKGPGPFTMVYVDPETGAVLNTRELDPARMGRGGAGPGVWFN